MATKKAKQPYQYEPLVTPSSWRDDEQRFSIRLTQIIDDLYQKYSALKQKTKNVEPSTPTDEPVDADTLNGKTAEDFLAVDGTAVNAEKLGGVPAEEYATKEDLSTIDIPAGVQMDLLWEKQGSGIQVGSSFPLAGDITNYDFIVMVSNHYKVGHRALWFKPVINSTVAVSAFGIANDTVTQMFVNEFVLQKTSVTYSKKRGINLSTSVQSFDGIGDLLTTIYGVKGLLK